MVLNLSNYVHCFIFVHYVDMCSYFRLSRITSLEADIKVFQCQFYKLGLYRWLKLLSSNTRKYIYTFNNPLPDDKF